MTSGLNGMGGATGSRRGAAGTLPARVAGWGRHAGDGPSGGWDRRAGARSDRGDAQALAGTDLIGVEVVGQLQSRDALPHRQLRQLGERDVRQSLPREHLDDPHDNGS